MPIDLYYAPGSCPCRAVYMLAKEIGVDINIKRMDLSKMEHLTPEYLALNPLHTVPTIVDDGFTLYKSQAILAYLANKYAKDDKLYPRDPQERANVDKMLFFDLENIFQPFINYINHQFWLKLPADPKILQLALDGINTLNSFLEKSKYAAGDHLTIADFALVQDILNLSYMDGVDLKKYPRVEAWIGRLRSEISSFEEINVPGLEVFKGILEVMKQRA